MSKSPPAYNKSEQTEGLKKDQKSQTLSLPLGTGTSSMQDQRSSSLSSIEEFKRSSTKGTSSTLQRLLSALRGDSNIEDLIHQAWGTPRSPTQELVMRYWISTRMQEHWEYLKVHHPWEFKRYLKKGYMEPIPTRWVQTQRLAWQYPEGSFWETPAEKRLYYCLNNGRTPDGSTHPKIRPLNINRNLNAIIRRGEERNAKQSYIDPQKLAMYQSSGDVFQTDEHVKSHQYSDQVPNTIYAARGAALHELANGISNGTDHLETMLLIDISGSMLYKPYQGVHGPDGRIRYHDQPPNIRLVEHLTHRVLQHMVPRTQREHPNQRGIETVTFSTSGQYIGQLSAYNFQHEWNRIQLGGGTNVMQGWQVVKNNFFQRQHDTAGHGRFDEKFGWQPTPGMPKLSLLVFLDGEANDMDEFELELLGESWAYCTIVLIGMEECPHHHSHALELERVAKFNPHVGFFDVHGRVCERLVVEDLLGSVYPVDPPQYNEILKPEYDLPAYSA